MLTADLVRVRFYRGEIRPRYLDADDPAALALAEQLIAVFAHHVGARRGELQAVLDELRGTDPDFLLQRGLTKLLFDRCTLESAAQLPPEELRQRIFAAAAERYRAPTEGLFTFDREAVLREVAEPLLYAPAALEAWLYADLKDEERLTFFEACTPEWLLARYNVALAQGVLLRATELEIDWADPEPRHTRELLRKIKFFQLLHRVERQPFGWRIKLDGPASIFQSTGKYGVAMASFLPTLLHFQAWALTAKIHWKERGASTFKIVPGQGLIAQTRLVGQWQPEELRWLPEQLAELDPAWQLDPEPALLEIGEGGLLVPDYVFVHGPSGCRVPMEIFGFWRRGALEKRLQQLRRHGPPELLIAIAKDLAAAHEEGLEDLPADVYVYRSQPSARQVLPRLRAALERFEARKAPKSGKKAKARKSKV